MHYLLYVYLYIYIYIYYIQYIQLLVGGLEHFLFSTIYGIILTIDELIFFKMVIAPPTSIYIYIYMCSIHNYIHLHTNKQGPARWSPH